MFPIMTLDIICDFKVDLGLDIGMKIGIRSTNELKKMVTSSRSFVFFNYELLAIARGTINNSINNNVCCMA